MAAFGTRPAQPACLNLAQNAGVWPTPLASEKGDTAGCGWAAGEDGDGVVPEDKHTPQSQPGRGGELSTGQLSPRPRLSAGCFG